MLDAAGDVEISVAVCDCAARVDNRVHSRSAEAVDGFSRDRDWQSGEKEGHAGDIAVVLAGLIGVAEYDVGDLVGGDFGVSPHELGDSVCGEVVGADG